MTIVMHNCVFSLKVFLFFLLCFPFHPLIGQDDITLLRFPALNPDGSQIAFSYQGDIWTTNTNGGTARRLTIHESYESHPQWSPDGQSIVFKGNRYGNNDIFSIEATGSRPMRLTYHSTSDNAPAFDHEGNVLFTTRRNFIQVEREVEIHQVAANGGTPFRLLDATGFHPKPSPDGRYIAFVRGNCRWVRETYNGPANRNLWLYDTQNKTYQMIAQHDAQDVYADWGADDQTLYFLSARNGRYNIYQTTIGNNGRTTGEPTAITNFTDEGIRYFDVSHNGQTIVFSRGTGVYTMDAKMGAPPTEVKIDVTEDYRFDPIEHKTYTKSANNYALSPNGKYVALEIRGEIFVSPNHKERKRTVQITKNPARDQGMTWLNDSTLIFISDRNGSKDVFLAKSANPATTDLFKTFKLEVKAITNTPKDVTQMALSPDRKKLVLVKGRGKMVVADIDANGSLSDEITLLDGWDIPEGIAWSPDSRWLAYAYEDLNFNEEIFIHAADGKSEPHNVSMHPRGDYSPKWSADGSKLGFMSIRNNGDADVWFVWLKKEDWEKTKNDWEESEYDEPEKKDKKKKDEEDKEKDDAVEPIQIDFDNIYQRIVQVTRLPGNEGDLTISKDGETFFFTTANYGRTGGGGEPEFMKIKWDGSEMKTVLNKGEIYNVSIDQNGKYLYYLKRGGSMARFKADADSPKPESLPYSAKMDIHHAAESAQVFDETWRSLNAGFYDPNFHGRDWEALKEKYRPRALAASTKQDFRDMTNEMLGQLDASHMGLYGSSPEETQQERTGLLGIEVMPQSNGVKITKIVPNSPASRAESTLEVGEVISAVNGEPINNTINFYSLLEGTRDEKIMLNVVSVNGTAKEMIIRPTSSLRSALYDSWVEERKALTDKYSNGKLGYLHIQGMNWPSFERFERELAASGYGKEGIVIDVRFNGGGWTTDMLMAVLNVRQHAYTVPRGAATDLDKENQKFKETYPYGERLPLSSWTKPSIALCNQNSYSNAEIFSHAFKTLNIGTLVGMPTFGAVISTGGQGLIDGSFVRMPFRAWYVKATGENMEHGPAVPDVIIENAPDSKAGGEDAQLKKSVEILLNEMN
ncbi:MAG: S41 family peptidase [Bacteroidota bacterium]